MHQCLQLPRKRIRKKLQLIRFLKFDVKNLNKMLVFPLWTKFNSSFVYFFEFKRNIISYGLSQFLELSV
jgi:hypothetical protein